MLMLASPTCRLSTTYLLIHKKMIRFDFDFVEPSSVAPTTQSSLVIP